MQRAIKFRGKDFNGEFVFGYYVKYLSQAYIYVVNGTDIKSIAVVPDTVGQFTGLHDKNGVEIYEGDIVEAWSQGTKATGEIKQEIDGCWIMYPAWQKGEFWYLMPNDDGNTTVKVIGNIHERSGNNDK